jgi:hypothetical protein
MPTRNQSIPNHECAPPISWHEPCLIIMQKVGSDSTTVFQHLACVAYRLGDELMGLDPAVRKLLLLAFVPDV